MQFTVTAYVNVDECNFFGYKPEHPIAEVDSFQIKAIHVEHAAEGMFVVGNRMGCDIHGKEWPADVRSLSVGDVLKIVTPPCHEHPRGATAIYACASVGWKEIPEPPNPIVAIEGTAATSRVAS